MLELDHQILEKRIKKKHEKDTKKELEDSFEKEKKYHYSCKAKVNNSSEMNPFVGQKCPHGKRY